MCLAETYALMPRFGDRFNYKTSAARAAVDVLESGYQRAVILRDGAIVEEILLNGATEFSFDRSVPGHVEMYLVRADGTKSGSVYAQVVKSSVTVTDKTNFSSGKLTVEFDGTSGTPLYVQVGSAHAVFCNVEGETETAEISFSASKVTTKYVRVAYRNAYGTYISNWAPFTGSVNTSADPLLSGAEYFDGLVLTPAYSSPVINSEKVGYYSYAMIPVQENTVYYSKGANRMWFFDANGNAISTYNASSSADKYHFTTPAGAAFVSIT